MHAHCATYIHTYIHTSPSLVDPTRVRALKDEQLRARFGLRGAEHLMKEFPCLLCEHVVLAGTLYVFNNYVCIGARFFDADIRRTTTIIGLSELQAHEQGAFSFKTHTGLAVRCDVGASQRDVVLGMLRLFVAQAKPHSDAEPLPPSSSTGLWRVDEFATTPYAPIEDGSADERLMVRRRVVFLLLSSHVLF